MKKYLAISLLVLTIVLSRVPAANASGSSITTDGTTSTVIQTCDDQGVCYLTTQVVDSSTSASYKQSALSEFRVPKGFFSDFGKLLNKLMVFVMAISVLLVLLYLIWGAINWITSGGDKGKIDQARQKLIAAVVGLIIVAASYAILTLAINFLGFDTLQEVIDNAIGPNIETTSTNTDDSASLGEVSQQEVN